MFRFTIRNWVWLSAVVLCPPAAVGQFLNGYYLKDKRGEIEGVVCRGKAEWLAKQEDPASHFHKLPYLKYLTLAGHAISLEEMKYVASLKNLQALDIGSVSWGLPEDDVTISGESLAQIGTMVGLVELEVKATGLIDKDLAFLPQCKSLKSLLVESDLSFSDVFLRYATQSKSLECLEVRGAGDFSDDAWAVDRLKQDYFSQDPDHVINIWLFRDKSSYEQNTVDIFGRRPHTPFGYYSAQHKALVMNIETGGGTLVHEIVHPFVAANFPGCPSWLNEGLGSLYEQCQDRNGHIYGLTNWRLHGLHEALKDEEYKMPTFEELFSTSTREFYEEDLGTNYAQARYLLYYLQEQGLLVTFYHEFRRSAQDDPTGYATLCKVLGRKKEDMDAFQKEWTEYVLALRF